MPKVKMTLETDTNYTITVSKVDDLETEDTARLHLDIQDNSYLNEEGSGIPDNTKYFLEVSQADVFELSHILEKILRFG